MLPSRVRNVQIWFMGLRFLAIHIWLQSVTAYIQSCLWGQMIVVQHDRELAFWGILNAVFWMHTQIHYFIPLNYSVSHILTSCCVSFQRPEEIAELFFFDMQRKHFYRMSCSLGPRCHRVIFPTHTHSSYTTHFYPNNTCYSLKFVFCRFPAFFVLVITFNQRYFAVLKSE